MSQPKEAIRVALPSGIGADRFTLQEISVSSEDLQRNLVDTVATWSRIYKALRASAGGLNLDSMEILLNVDAEGGVGLVGEALPANCGGVRLRFHL